MKRSSLRRRTPLRSAPVRMPDRSGLPHVGPAGPLRQPKRDVLASGGMSLLTQPKRRGISLASREQRASIDGRCCVVCGSPDVMAMHVIDRSLGGCDDALCVVLSQPGSMSGGSFNYLCHREPLDLPSEDVAHMASELRAASAVDAADATDAILAEIRSFTALLEQRLEPLRSVWMAMEWWQSCDWSEEQFRAALAGWRERMAE